MKFDLRLQNWLHQKKTSMRSNLKYLKSLLEALTNSSVIILQKIGKPFVISNFYPFITGIWYSECYKSATIA